jgi:hypothetical protein
MHAMVLKKLGAALEWAGLADRSPGPGEIRVKVGACGVCRTDLHVVDGELPDPKLPIIPGHEIAAESMRSETGSRGRGSGSESAFPGSATPAGGVRIVRTGMKIYAITHSSRATPATAALRRRQSPMRATRSRSARPATTRRLRRSSAPA